MFEASSPGRDSQEFTETNIIIGILAFVWVEYLWELIIKIRQHLVFMRETAPPVELQDALPQEYYDRSRNYNLEKSAFTIFKDFVVVILKTSVIVSHSHAKMWTVSGEVMRSIGVPTENNRELVRSCVAVGLSNLINSFTFIPFKLFETFYMDRRYGQSKQTFVNFMKEQLKTAVVTAALLQPMVAGIVYIVQHGGQNFFLHLWMYIIVMMVIYLTVYPELIAPFFDTYVPLPEGELLSRIRNLASDLGFSAPSVFVVEGSRGKSLHEKLTLTGAFGRSRIDIDCHIIKGYKNASGTIDVGDQGLNNDMLISLVARELAHRKLNHLIKKSIIIQASLFLELYFFSHMYQYTVLYSAFGFRDQPIIMGFLITLEILLAPYHMVGNLLMAAINRKYELESDQYTRTLGLGVFLRKAITTLAKQSLLFPSYDQLYVKWFEKCPTLRQRLEVLQNGF